MTMNGKSLGLALTAGVATFLIVGVAITEFAQPWVEFSLFLGIPVGFVAGAFTAAAVYFGLADDELAQRRHIAGAFVGFGVVFLIVLIALGSLLNLGVTFALGIAFVVGMLVGIGAYVRESKGPETSGDDEGTSGMRSAVIESESGKSCE